MRYIEQDLKDKTILITGGAGFIGSHLVEALAARGRAVAPDPAWAVRSARECRPRRRHLVRAGDAAGRHANAAPGDRRDDAKGAGYHRCDR